MSDLTCITEASCAPGDHTYSWPCVLAQMPQRSNPIGEAICAPLIWTVELIGWALDKRRTRFANDRAGFEVYGVDIEPQPHYPFAFHRGDATTVLEHLLADGQIGWTLPGTACVTCGKPPHQCITGFQVWYRLADFDAVHISPPCQRFSDLAKRNGNADDWPDLVAPARELLDQTGPPYIIENVEGAPLHDPVMLCGSMFPELRVYRHRLFESNIERTTPEHQPHRELTFTHDKRKRHYGQPLDLTTMRVQVTGGGNAPIWAKRKAMGDLDWMTGHEVNEAIPPAYTEHIGRQLLAHIESERAA